MGDRWFDRTMIASAHGFDSGRLSVAVPIRRWIGAKWFQPVVKIGSEDTYEQVLAPVDGALPETEAKTADVDDSGLGWFEPISQLPAGELARAEAQWNDRHQRRTRFVAEFTADNDGDLFLYVNDAVNVLALGGYDLFYRNNRGTASVWLQQKSLPQKPLEQAAR
jgi:hypothetical protein